MLIEVICIRISTLKKSGNLNVLFVLILFSVILSGVLISCESKKAFEGEELLLNRSDFTDDRLLKGELIQLDAGFSPDIFNVLNDSLVAVERYLPKPYYYGLYNYKTNEHLFDFALRGKGPHEMLSVTFKYKRNEDYFSVHDVVTNRCYIYDIKSLLIKKEQYSPTEILLSDLIFDYDFQRRDSLIGFNHYSFEWNDIKNETKPLLGFNWETPSNYYDSLKVNLEYFTMNVNQNMILIAPNNYIWIIHRYEDVIDIYDEQGDKVKRIVGPDFLSGEYFVREHGHVSGESGYYLSYFSGFVGKTGMFLAYVGFDGVSLDVPQGKNVELFKFNWKGELEEAYVLDRFIRAIWIDEEEEYLYGTDIQYANTDSEHFFYRYELD